MATQFLHGLTRPVEVPFDTTDSTIAYAVGDLIYLDASGYATPIGSVTVTTSFVGVCAQRKDAGTTGTAKRIFGNGTDGIIRVDTDGEFDFARADTVALSVGDLVAPTGNQIVTKTSTESISVGRVVKAVAAGATRCRVKIQSAKVPAAKTT